MTQLELKKYGLFEAYGIELEYMIVSRETLEIRPIADELLRAVAGKWTTDVVDGPIGWSNELVAHLLEIKNEHPVADLASLPDAFAASIARINGLLEPKGAMLLPTAMHPWMDPAKETRIWPHEYREIYETYNRIFDCRRHGWANLQSMHVNLSFSGDAEFARLHAAVRLVLPILPALAASSPFEQGTTTGFLDNRLKHYFAHTDRVPAMTGRVIPEQIWSEAAYRQEILERIYRDLEAHDPEGRLREEFANARGAIARFDRDAIEVRLIDIQETPKADLAIAALVSAVIKALSLERWVDLHSLKQWGIDSLLAILEPTLRMADRTVIEDADYLRVFGYPEGKATAGGLWSHLFEALVDDPRFDLERWCTTLEFIFEEGPLARRLVAAAGENPSRADLIRVYRELSACLAEGRLFGG